MELLFSFVGGRNGRAYSYLKYQPLIPPIMFKLDLDRLVRLRGKSNVIDYLVKEGKFSRSVARRLADPKAKSWRPEHLLRLCLLFKCDPNTLIVYVGSDPFLAAVSAQEQKVNVVSFDSLLKDMSAKELEAIYKMILGLRDGSVG